MTRALTPSADPGVLLIAPPVFDFYSTPARMEPLGLYYLKYALEKEGLKADIYDAFRSRRSKRVRAPESLSYLDQYYQEDTSPFSLFRGYYRFGDSFGKIVQAVRDGGYDTAAITSNFSAYHPDVEALTRLLRAETDLTLIIGGWAVWAGGAGICDNSGADYLIADSGLASLPGLVRALRQGSDPLLPRRRETPLLLGCDRAWKPVQGSEPEGCPEPAIYALTPEDQGGLCRRGSEPSAADSGPAGGSDPFMEGYPQRPGGYFFRGRPLCRLVLSRGCGHRCSFCSVHRRYSFQRRPLALVAEEMAYLTSTGARIIDLEDDNLFAGRDYTLRLLEIMKGVRAHTPDTGFTAMNGITALNLEPFTEEAIEAGFIEFNLSMVAGDPLALKNLNRPDFKAAIESIAWKSAARTEVLAFIICGLPGSTPGSVLEDILFLARLPLKIGFSPLYPVPGAPLFDALTPPSDLRLLRGSALWAFGTEFPREEALSLWKLTRMLNYLKETPLPDPEALEYFGRSVREKVWYLRSKEGQWKPGFSFRADLPHKISLCSWQGAVKEFTF